MGLQREGHDSAIFKAVSPKAGMKISGRTIKNLRYADDITLKVESKEELKSLLMKVRE